MKLTKFLYFIVKILILSALLSLILFNINCKIEENKKIMHNIEEEVKTLETLKSQVDEALIEVTNTYNVLDVVHNYSQAYSVPPEIILAVMKVESNFNTNVISSNANYGIMQVNRVNLKHLDNKLDALDLKTNIECGVFLLSELQKKNANLEYILNSYNMGESGYSYYLTKNTSPSRTYSKKVIKYINVLKGE